MSDFIVYTAQDALVYAMIYWWLVLPAGLVLLLAARKLKERRGHHEY